jgi:hypothetical protein
MCTAAARSRAGVRGSRRPERLGATPAGTAGGAAGGLVVGGLLRGAGRGGKSPTPLTRPNRTPCTQPTAAPSSSTSCHEWENQMRRRKAACARRPLLAALFTGAAGFSCPADTYFWGTYEGDPTCVKCRAGHVSSGCIEPYCAKRNDCHAPCAGEWTSMSLTIADIFHLSYNCDLLAWYPCATAPASTNDCSGFHL